MDTRTSSVSHISVYYESNTKYNILIKFALELLADKFKASIFERTKDGSTLMHIASLNGHADCAMMLFKKGVYLHMPNKVSAF